MNKSRVLMFALRVTPILLIGSVFTFALWPNSKSHWKKPQITVRLIGMTNDTSWPSQAKFEVRNADDRDLVVELPGWLTLGNSPPEPAFAKLDTSRWFGTTNVMLKPGALLIACVNMPPTHDRWRVEFLCSLPLSWVQRAKNYAADRGLPVLRAGKVVSHASSEWLEPPRNSDLVDPFQSQSGQLILGP